VLLKERERIGCIAKGLRGLRVVVVVTAALCRRNYSSSTYVSLEYKKKCPRKTATRNGPQRAPIKVIHWVIEGVHVRLERKTEERGTCVYFLFSLLLLQYNHTAFLPFFPSLNHIQYDPLTPHVYSRIREG
jgi:hypothetical protein